MSKECLALVFSDLHLGEEDSILMYPDSNEGVNRHYLEALKEFLSQSIGTERVRYLILAGDALDLSLARRRQAFLAFKTFLEGMQDLFSEAVIYLPGNHDHHLWVALQEEALIFQKVRAGRPVEPYYHALCPYLDEEGIRIPGRRVSTPYGKKTFLYHLLSAEAQEDGRGILVAYPNLYVHTGDFSILITHGHFFEEAWRLFTDLLKESLAKMGLKRLNFKKLEQINSPFIEFGWYSLGQAGELSKLIEKLWDDLQAGGTGPITEGVLEDLIHYLDERLTREPRHRKSLLGKLGALMGHFTGTLFEVGSDAALRFIAEILKYTIVAQLAPKGDRHSGAPLRHFPRILSEDRTRARIEDYLEMALPAFKELNTLIFGHTHVPFEHGRIEIDTVAGRKGVTCFNTGGWVTDVYEADHLAISRPFVFALGEEVKTLEIPWPSYEEFESILEGVEGEDQARELVKKLAWGKLF
ncbi:metallophosphoesterase [Thermosulfurimonas dismutans]|uniref:Calcineurin-like phosphoesterase domain-containing protein n=1 Tax=Thermosulfurimonas dismutans TaxID=999894 RepID=A0A179D716_9BACT|nr:metallophosphoesterase [Thermosulfurimonas dismutans]OAQ21837.1 hypothetical protein TDIS_0355 [Thermosulfurimonas dismutans]